MPLIKVQTRFPLFCLIVQLRLPVKMTEKERKRKEKFFSDFDWKRQKSEKTFFLNEVKKSVGWFQVKCLQSFPTFPRNIEKVKISNWSNCNKVDFFYLRSYSQRVTYFKQQKCGVKVSQIESINIFLLVFVRIRRKVNGPLFAVVANAPPAFL